MNQNELPNTVDPKRSERIQMKVYTSTIEIEILRILLTAGTRLRPSQILEILRERGMELHAPNRIYYHLMKLTMLNLITNEKIDRDLSFYEITDEGKQILLASRSKEDLLKEIAAIMSPNLKKSKEEVYKILATAFLDSG